jgi:integrase
MTEEEFRRAWAIFQAQSSPGTAVAPPPPPTTTVNALYKRWAEKKAGLASFKDDDGRAEKLLAWKPSEGPFVGVALGERDPMTLTAPDVDMLRADLGKKDTRRGKPPTVATLNRVVMVLQRVLNFGVSRKTIPSNPIKGVKPEKENNVREVIVTEEGFESIMGCISHPIVRAFVALAFESGMRRGELLKLTWRQIDWDAGVITIPAAHTKAKKTRYVDFAERSAHELKQQPQPINKSLRVLPIDGRWVHELFVRAVDHSGVRGVDGRPPRLHDLRRSYVTLARRRGVSESVIMKLSGHQTNGVFRRYSIVGDEDLREAKKTMAEKRAQELAALAEKRKNPQRAGETEAEPAIAEPEKAGKKPDR